LQQTEEIGRVLHGYACNTPLPKRIK